MVKIVTLPEPMAINLAHVVMRVNVAAAQQSHVALKSQASYVCTYSRAGLSFVHTAGPACHSAMTVVDLALELTIISY